MLALDNKRMMYQISWNQISKRKQLLHQDLKNQRMNLKDTWEKKEKLKKLRKKRTRMMPMLNMICRLTKLSKHLISIKTTNHWESQHPPSWIQMLVWQAEVLNQILILEDKLTNLQLVKFNLQPISTLVTTTCPEWTNLKTQGKASNLLLISDKI